MLFCRTAWPSDGNGLTNGRSSNLRLRLDPDTFANLQFSETYEPISPGMCTRHGKLQKNIWRRVDEIWIKEIRASARPHTNTPATCLTLNAREYHPGVVVRNDVSVAVLWFVDLQVGVLPRELLTGVNRLQSTKETKVTVKSRRTNIGPRACFGWCSQARWHLAMFWLQMKDCFWNGSSRTLALDSILNPNERLFFEMVLPAYGLAAVLVWKNHHSMDVWVPRFEGKCRNDIWNSV